MTAAAARRATGVNLRARSSARNGFDGEAGRGARRLSPLAAPQGQMPIARSHSTTVRGWTPSRACADRAWSISSSGWPRRYS